MEVGKSIVRVDAFDKVTGRTKYTDDLCDASAYVAKCFQLIPQRLKKLKVL